MNLRIAYMTGEYPRISDTFIQREIASLRKLGVHIETISIRRTSNSQHVGPEQRAEFQRTYSILPVSPVRIATAHLNFLLRSPDKWFSTLLLSWKTKGIGFKALLRQFAYFIESALVAKFIQKRKLTHLHNHFANSSGTVAMLASAMGGFSFSLTMHGPAIFFEPQRWRIDVKCQRALFILCISHYCRSQAMIWAPQKVWQRLHIIHCGVDPEIYQQRNHSETGKKLLFVGRLASVKGLPVLIDAMKLLVMKYPNLMLTIVGDGPDRALLEEQTNQLGLKKNIHYTGPISQAEVANKLASTDVFVLPSFAEGVPVVLMEAMASGVPVVATQIAGVSELVEEGVSGYLVPPGDQKLLANRITTLLSSCELRKQMGHSGRQKVKEEFNTIIEANHILTILHNRLEGKKCPIRPSVPLTNPISSCF